MRFAVLGSSGMLGSVVAEALAENHEVVRWDRSSIGDVSHIRDDPKHLAKRLDLASFDYVVNCLGMVKNRIGEEDPDSVSQAIKVNSVFPHLLAQSAEISSSRVITVVTDCVFSGRQGKYVESDPHDALDVYGKTKSLGESLIPTSMNVRISFIGVGTSSTMLFDWVRSLPLGAQIEGYTDHIWNGATTQMVAKVIRGIAEENLFEAGVQHLVPNYSLTKYELVRDILDTLGRHDVTLTPVAAGKVDRSLSTENTTRNEQLWGAGLGQIPSSLRPALSKLVSENGRD